MESDSRSLVLHLPVGLRYECIRCGRSCEEFSEIQADRETAERIRGLAREALAGALNPENPVVESISSPGMLVMRQEGGSRCLKTRDGLYAIHAAAGPAAKPDICQSFPYRFAETADGVFTGLSFVCSAVLGNLGPPVSGQREAVERLFHFTQSRHKVSEPLALTEDLPLSWRQYTAIEADLERLLDPAYGPIGRRLVMQAIYLRLLTDFLRQARGRAGALAAGTEANEEALAVFHRQMRGNAADPWPLPRKLADRRRPSRLLRRMILGLDNALLNMSKPRGGGRLRSYRLILDAYLRQATGHGVVRLPRLSRPIPYRELREIRFDPSRPGFDELLTRYFRHRFFRKDLLIRETIQFNHSMLLMQCGLAHWYGAAFAADRGGDEIQLADLSEGIRNAEKSFILHTKIDNLFRRYPILRGFIDRLFDHPLYAYSMGWGEWWRESRMKEGTS